MIKELENSLTTLEKNKTKILNIVAVLTIAVLAVYAIWFNLNGASLSTDPAHWAEFGDYVGGILNPIFGFVTVVMLLHTLLQQQKSLLLSQRELELSREELTLTRYELEDSRKALEGQEQALKIQSDSFLIQNFENRFFNLLSNLLESMRNINIKYYEQISIHSNQNGKEIKLSGDQAITYLLNSSIKSSIQMNVGMRPIDLNEEEQFFENLLFLAYKSLSNSKLINIIRKLSIITNFIYRSYIGQNMKNEYFDIILSNITDDILIIFYLHAAFDPGTKFSVNESQFFKYLPAQIHTDQHEIKIIYLSALRHGFNDNIFGKNPNFKGSTDTGDSSAS